jgi:hypothetical protein
VEKRQAIQATGSSILSEQETLDLVTRLCGGEDEAVDIETDGYAGSKQFQDKVATLNAMTPLEMLSLLEAETQDKVRSYGIYPATTIQSFWRKRRKAMLANGKQFILVNIGVFSQSDYIPKYRWVDIDEQTEATDGQFMCCPRCATYDDHFQGNYGENPDGWCEKCEDIVMSDESGSVWNYARRFYFHYEPTNEHWFYSLRDVAIVIQAAARNRKMKRLNTD